jgi:capsular exopolysaccharide synthesis family protein
MGRIDDALQRAGHRSRVEAVSNVVSPLARSDTFASPWAFRAGSEEQPIEEAAPPNALAAALDAPESHSLQRFSDAWTPRLVIADDANVRLVEEFRQLAATLHQAQATSNIRVIMVTSAEPAEGKSTTSVNLALTLSESYKRRVLLVDADLRRPSLHEITQVPNSKGLGETLKALGEQKLPLFKLSETLMLAPAGRPDQNPMGALTSPRMRHILLEASMQFDWVIIDAPPIGPVADSSLLAPLSDGVLLVVRARRTHYASAQQAIEAIGRDRILGVVLNDAEIADSPAYNRYYHGYYADDARRS